MSHASRFIAFGITHHSTPVEVRERLAIPSEQVPGLYEHLRGIAGVKEILVLGTCNRFEVYGVLADGTTAEAVERALCTFHALPEGNLAAHRFALEGSDAVQHLLEVASGVDSQIIGETEIFGQVKAAYAHASTLSAVGPVLNRVFQKSFQAAKYIRHNTSISDGPISVATVAVDLTEKVFGQLADCRVLIIGTGEIGEKAVRAMHSRGAGSITVLSRTTARAEQLAAAVSARAGSLDQVGEMLATHDIVVGSTTVTSPVVTHDMIQTLMRTRRLEPLFFIDLGLPRNFDPSLADVNSVFLYDLDDLARIADENLATRRAAIERCRRIAEGKAVEIWKGVQTRGGGAPRPASDEFEASRQTV